MKIKQLLKRVTAIVLVGMLLVGIVPITALAYVFTFEESPRVEHIEITAFSPNYFIDISSEQFPISSEHIAITAFVPRHNEVFAESYATIIDLEVSLVASSENSTLLRYEILHNGRLVSGNQLSESMEILAFADNLFDDVPMLEAHEGISGERDDEIEAERLRELANAPMSENVALLGDIAIDSLPVSVHRMSHNIMYGIELVQSAHAGNYNVIIHYEVDGVSRTHSTGVFYLDVVEKDLQISIDGFNDDLFGMDFTDFSGIQPFSAANPEVRVYNASGVHQVNINTLRAALTSTLAGRRIYILRDLNNLGNWVPVNPTANFTLDGQGHILTLTVAVSGAGSNAGLFGSASNRIITIQNVGIQVEDISARHEVDTGTANTRAGGFFGLVNGGTITIRQSFVAGGYVWARTGRNNDNRLHRNTWSHAGGFIGDVQGGANVTIEDSFVGARVYARSHSGSSGNTAQAMAGGFIGHVWNSTLTIRRSYASGTVFSYARNPHIFGTSESYGGGIVGRRTGGSAPTVTHVAFANDLNIRGISIGGGTLTLGTRLNLTQLRNSSTAPLNNWSWGSVWEFRGDSDATNVDFSMWGHPVLRVFYNVRRVDFSTFTNPLPGDFRDITATIPQGRQRLRYRARSGDARQMPTITWQSSNAWVASVPPTPNPTPRFSNQGATSIRVSAVNSGSAVITPTVRGVPLIGFNFNVNQPPSTDIRFNRVNHGVIQDGSTIRLARGTTSTTGNITATVDPSNANQNVTWNVNNTFFGSPGSSVTMSGTGNTRNFTAGNALGTARITATSVGTPAINRSFNISVHHVYPTSVTFNTAAVNTQRGIGQTFTLSPQTTLPATRTTDNLTWTISTAHRNILDFATSGSGNTRTGANVSLIGRDAGTARVTASIFNTLTQQNITLGYVDITVSPVTVTINHAGTIVPIPMQVGGATRALTASVSPAGAPQNVQWSVSQGNAVTVNASGVVSPARAGDATVTASLGTALSVPPASVARPSDSVVFEVLPLFSGGTGTVADPWRISTFADLNNIRDYVRAFPDRTRHHFILTHDIGTTANPIPVGHNWQPIGGNGHPDFVGVFDGNGHRIIGLNIDRANYDYVGLFGRVGSGGVIRNVGLLNARVTGRRYVGGIAGFTAGDILNSFNEAGDVYGAVAAVNGMVYVGGIVGKKSGSGVIERTFNSGTVRAVAEGRDSTAFAGGIVGKIENNGGLVNETTVRNSYAKGEVIAESASVYRTTIVAGGLIGAYRGRVVIADCYTTDISIRANATGQGETDVIAGGLVGRNENNTLTGPGQQFSSEIRNSYTTAHINAVSAGGDRGITHTGGLLGSEEIFTAFGGSLISTTRAIITNSYFLNTQVIETTSIYDYRINVGTPLTEAQMRNAASFIGWNFTAGGDWFFEEGVNNGFPVLRGLNNNTHTSPTSVSLDRGEITLPTGEWVHMVATIAPAHASVRAVNWTSDNEDVAFVGTRGTITARNPGRATITARSASNPSLFATVVVTVFPRVATPNATLLNSDDADNLLVALHSDTPGAVIYFTINEPNSIPDRTSTRYTGPIPISVTSYVQARAFVTFDDPVLGTFEGSSNPAGFLYTVMQAANPVASHDSGILPFGTIITFSGATQGSTVRHTATTAIGNASPSAPGEVTSDSPILSSIRLDRSMNVNARAFHPTRFDSSTVMFSFQAQVDAPVFLPGDGAELPFNAPITIASMTPGAVIRYTTDGSEPTESSAVYSSPIAITMNNTTIRARAFLDGCVPSEIVSATFTLGAPPIEVNVDPTGIIASGSPVNIFSADTNTRGMVIRYTTDGSEPNGSSPLAWRYAIGGGGVSTPIIITDPIIIRARFFSEGSGMPISDIRAFDFDNVVIASPTANILSGTRIRFDDTITLSSIATDAQIRYTTDGSAPNENSALYVAPIFFGEQYLNQQVLIRAIAHRPGLPPSREVSFTYIIEGQITSSPVADLSIRPLVEDAAGIPFRGHFVTLISEPGATIHFTTNGTVPTRNSPIYTQPILVTSENPIFTVRAMAVSDGKISSEVVTFNYDVAVLDAILQEDIGQIELELGSLGPILLPSNVPMLGGSEISLDFGMIPTSMVIEDGKIMVGIGVEIGGADEFGDLQNMVRNGRPNTLFDAMRDFKPTPQPYFRAMGYLIGTVPAPGEEFSLGGGISVKIGVRYNLEKQFIIVVVPVVVGLTLDANVGFEGQLGFVGDAIKPKATLVGVIPHVEVRGGIGIAYIVSVGAFGNAEMNVRWDILEDEWHLGFAGSWGAYARALFWEYRIPAMSGTFWCTCGDCARFGWAWQQAHDISTFSTDVPILLCSDGFTLAPRNHLSTQSSWMGNQPNIRPLVANDAPEIRVLQQSVYDQIAPQIAEANGTRVMVFLADDGSRGDMNRTALMYSVYDNLLDTWSVPRQIDNTDTANTADFFPNIASDGENIWVTWHNSSVEFSSEATLSDMLASSEISVARFNGTTFTDIMTLTNNNVMNTQPKIAVDNGNVTVVWVRNESNEILGLTDRRADSRSNKLMAIQFANGVWGDEIVLKSDLSAIIDTAIGHFGSNVRIAYIVDMDNDFNTIHDRSLIVIDINGNITSTPVSGNLVSNPAFTGINGMTVLSWYEIIETVEDGETFSGGNIRYMMSNGAVHTLFNANDMLTDNFRMISNNGQTAVIYPHTEDSAGSIRARIYNNGRWSESFTLADTGGFARNFDGVWDDNGNFYIAYNNSRMSVIGENENATLIESNDLNVLRARPLPNVRLANVFFAHQDVLPGGRLPVTARMENIGGQRVDNVTVFVNGNETGTFLINSGLQIGETTELEFEIPMPNNLTEQTHFIVTIVPSGSFGFDMRDNSYTLTVGAPNLTLNLTRNLVDENDENGAIRITAVVENETRFLADATLTVRRDSLDGEILDIVNMGNLSAGQESTTADLYIVPSVFVPDGDSSALLFFEVTSNRQEVFMSNTTDFMIIFAPNEVFGITLSPNNDMMFDSVSQGYGDIAPHWITISNTGNQPTGTLNILLFGEDADSFVLSESMANSIESGQVSSFTVEPIPGLLPGTYSAVVMVNGSDNIEAQSLSVSFTVYAEYSHSITVLSDYGGTASANISSASQGTEITLFAEANNGYRFVRWEVISGIIDLSSVTGNPTTFQMPNHEVMVLAVFESTAYSYSVTFNLNGGNMDDYTDDVVIWVNQNTTIGASIGGVAIPNPIRNGYTFSGWRYMGQETTAPNLTGEQVAQITVNADMTLFAIWQSNAGVRLGDVTGRGVIDLADIILLRRYVARHFEHISGNTWRVINSVPEQTVYFNRAAADVNADGSINLADIILLRRYVARHPGVVLGLQPASFGELGISPFGISEAFSDESDPIQVSASTTSGVAGEYVDVVIYVDANPGFIGLQLELQYDATVLTPTSVTSGTLIPLPIQPTLTDDQLSLVFESTSFENVHGSGELAIVRFKVLPDAEPGYADIGLNGILAIAGEPKFIEIGVLATSGYVEIYEEPIFLSGEAIIIASDGAGVQGEYVDIVVSLNENPGAFALGFDMVYDADALEVVEIMEGMILPMHVSRMLLTESPAFMTDSTFMSEPTFMTYPADVDEESAGQPIPMLGLRTITFNFTEYYSLDTDAIGELVVVRFRIRDNAIFGQSVIVLNNGSGRSVEITNLDVILESGTVEIG